MKHVERSRYIYAIAAFLALAALPRPAAAQGVTTGSLGGVVSDAQGAVVPGTTITAAHVPSGRMYEGTGQDDRANNITVDGSYFNNSFLDAEQI
jgi:hypothetical protein